MKFSIRDEAQRRKINGLPAIKLEELTGVELAAIPAAGAPLPWSLTMGSTHKETHHVISRRRQIMT